MEDSTILHDFMIEAEEIIEEAEIGLLEMDKGSDFQDNYNAVFRAFHSLKGAAGMFGLDALQSHMHKLESLFEEKKNDGTIAKEQIDYFLNGIDAAKQILSGEEIAFRHVANFEDLKKDPSDPIEEEVLVAKKEELAEKKEKKERGFIYIVDDESEIVSLINDMLSDAGYVTKTFTKAQDLLNSLDGEYPDLILSDISMPEMDGEELLDKIREIDQDLPLVFISGFITKEIMLRSLNSGAQGFIEKPINENKVLNICNILISRKRAMKLLNRSIDFIMYQFSDLDSFLEQKGKDRLRISLRDELQTILEMRKQLKDIR